MSDHKTYHPPHGDSDRRHLLVNELWRSIRVIVEESELDAVQRDELIGSLEMRDARRGGTRGVSLRSLPDGGWRDAFEAFDRGDGGA